MADEMSIEGKVLDASAIVAAPEALAALTRLVDTAGKYVAIHEEEARKREELRTYRETEVATIKAAEGTLQRYFANIFSERREVYQHLLLTDASVEDEGVAQGDDDEGLNVTDGEHVDVRLGWPVVIVSPA